MEIKNITNAEKLPLNVDAWKLLNNDKIEIIFINIPEYQYVEKHINPLDVIFYVIEGSGELYIENNKFILSAGDCISVKKNLERTWKNHSAGILKILVIKIL